MSDDDLIRRGDALATVQLGDTVTKLQSRIRALPAVEADPVCTGCGGTGITNQTERRCACQGPDLSDPVAVHANMLRGTIAKPTVEQIIHLYGRQAFRPMIDAAVTQPAPHVNETPKTEHDAGNVLTDADAIRAAARLVSREAATAREVFEDYGSKAKEAIDYMEQLLLAALREGGRT